MPHPPLQHSPGPAQVSPIPRQIPPVSPVAPSGIAPPAPPPLEPPVAPALPPVAPAVPPVPVVPPEPPPPEPVVLASTPVVPPEPPVAPAPPCSSPELQLAIAPIPANAASNTRPVTRRMGTLRGVEITSMIGHAAVGTAHCGGKSGAQRIQMCVSALQQRCLMLSRHGCGASAFYEACAARCTIRDQRHGRQSQLSPQFNVGDPLNPDSWRCMPAIRNSLRPRRMPGGYRGTRYHTVPSGTEVESFQLCSPVQSRMQA